ncbi:MAG: type II and III secretion system protein [Bacteroidota bacterium]
MKYYLLYTCLFLWACFGAFAQEPQERIVQLENQLSLLKVDAKGLEEMIDVNISQTTLSNFLLAISKVHDININVSPELKNITIVNNFSDVTVEVILLFLAKEYNLDIQFTGNILSIKQFVPERVALKEKEIQFTFHPESKNVSFDLRNDPLEKVFRKIMDQSGKNLLYIPEIQSTPLTLYLKNVPFELALSKLAETNDLILNKTKDGFYVFDTALVTSSEKGDALKKIRRKHTGFDYRIIDSIQRQVAVQLQNTPIEDVIYTLGSELGLDIFTAAPLENAGVATVDAQNISFDLLLEKIFASQASGPAQDEDQNSGSEVSSHFTYKKEGDVYYFGTEDQLSLKQVEFITMMHRAIQMLENPTEGMQRRAGRNNFNTNTSNLFNPQNSFQQNQNNNLNNSGSGQETKLTSITDIIPDDIKDGLEIKVDTELNSFIVSGPSAKVERFKDFITFIDKPVPVILIEVMILEVNRSSLIESGISFGIGDKPVTTTGEFFPNANVSLGAKDVNKIIGGFNGFGSLNIGKVVPNFYLDIKAMEASGTLKVLSTPKLSTINGHKAFLSSGETTYYAVTSQNFFGSQIPQTSEIRNYVPIDAELSLEILPFVAGDGEITLDIQVLQSAFNGERVADDAPPGLSSREFSSVVRMRDQDIAVLGGIEQVRKDNSGSGVPGLSKVPILKWFVSKRKRESIKRNLSILIKPTIIQ